MDMQRNDLETATDDASTTSVASAVSVAYRDLFQTRKLNL